MCQYPFWFSQSSSKLIKKIYMLLNENGQLEQPCRQLNQTNKQNNNRMKKIKNDKSDIRNNQEYLNFIRRNKQIVEQFKEINRIQKNNFTKSKRISSSFIEDKGTIQTQRYEQTMHNAVTIRIPEKKNINDIILLGNRNNFEGDLPIHTRKQSKHRFLYSSSHNKIEVVSKNYTNNVFVQTVNSQNPEAISSKKLPRIHQEYDGNHSEKQRKQTENSIEKMKDLKYDLIPIECEKKSDEYQKAKVKNIKFAQIQKTKINDKVIKKYSDYDKAVDFKNKISELIPTLKPLQPKKKEKFQILQLNSEFDGQLNKFLETSKVKKFQRQNHKSKEEKNENEEEKDLLKKESIKIFNSEKNKRKNLMKYEMPKRQTTSIFRYNGTEQTVYEQKIRSYREFLFLVNFAHRIYDPLILENDSEKYKMENKYKYYVGSGNNSMLIKSLMKRRFWWTQVDDPMQANFVWTQLKVNNFYQFQQKHYIENKFDKISSEKMEKQMVRKKINFRKGEIKQNQKLSGILRGNLPQNEAKIFTKIDSFYFQQMKDSAQNKGKLVNFSYRLKYLPENFLLSRENQPSQCFIHNHFFQNYSIGNKKALFYNLKKYYNLVGKNVFNIIPLTFHIKKGLTDPEYSIFLKEFKKLKLKVTKEEKKHSKKISQKNIWIAKPGELSNRGNGITVFEELYEVNNILKSKQKHENGMQKTYIIQKYIQNPLLYKGRKFDIRHFMVVSRLHGRFRAYWFSEGFIRTSSYEYDIDEVNDQFIHLTNDAIQKQGPDYGKYEEGNKISYNELQRYIDSAYPEKKYSFIESTYPKMKQIATDAIKSTYLSIDPDQTQHNFQIFGLDFMIDANFNVWLIEVNTNPCLELSSLLLSRIIPAFMEHTFRLTIDPIFPPTAHYFNSIKYLTPNNPIEKLQFELIFDEGRDGKELAQLFKGEGKVDYGQIDEDDETYENDGNQLQLGGDLD